MIREGVTPARSKIMHAPPPLRVNKPENIQQVEHFDRSSNQEIENNKRFFFIKIMSYKIKNHDIILPTYLFLIY